MHLLSETVMYIWHGYTPNVVNSMTVAIPLCIHRHTVV